MSPRLPAGILLCSLIVPGALVGLEGRAAERASGASVPPEGPTEAGLEKEFREAREQLRSSPEFAGTDAESHIRFAKALHHRGDLTGATEEYQAAISLNPELTDAYRGLGVLFLDRHDWDGAVKALTSTTQRRPDDPEAFYWLGRALMARRDWSDAVEALTTAIRLNPNDAEAYADLGLIRMVQGNPASAAEALRQAVTLKPDYADAHGLLETVLTHQHDSEYVTRAARHRLDTMFARE